MQPIAAIMPNENCGLCGKLIRKKGERRPNPDATTKYIHDTCRRDFIRDKSELSSLLFDALVSVCEFKSTPLKEDEDVFAALKDKQLTIDTYSSSSSWYDTTIPFMYKNGVVVYRNHPLHPLHSPRRDTMNGKEIQLDNGDWSKEDKKSPTMEFVNGDLKIHDSSHRDGQVNIDLLQEDLAPYNVFSLPEIKKLYPAGGRSMVGRSKQKGLAFHSDATDSIIHYYRGDKILFVIIGENAYRSFFIEYLTKKTPKQKFDCLLRHPGLRWVRVSHGVSIFIAAGVPHASFGVDNDFIAPWYLSITACLRLYPFQAFWKEMEETVEYEAEAYLMPFALAGAHQLCEKRLAEMKGEEFIYEEIEQFKRLVDKKLLFEQMPLVANKKKRKLTTATCLLCFHPLKEEEESFTCDSCVSIHIHRNCYLDKDPWKPNSAFTDAYPSLLHFYEDYLVLSLDDPFRCPFCVVNE